MKRSETRESMSFFRHPTLGMIVRKERLIFTASLLTIPVEQDIPGKLLSSRACFRLPVRNEINLQSGNKKVLTFTQQKNCPAKLDHLTLPKTKCDCLSLIAKGAIFFDFHVHCFQWLHKSFWLYAF
jgi:hypothetical protein